MNRTGLFTTCLLAADLLVAPVHAVAAESSDPDWPCVQRKVPSLTPAAIWTGPAIDVGLEWRSDERVADLVNRLRQRRMPVEEAKDEIEGFAAELDEGEREKRLTLLFAGLFETMNAERGEILDGIERYARRQKQFADAIRQRSAELAELRASAEPDDQSVMTAQDELDMMIRVFDERRSSLPYICEVPRMVEQRLFTLGRAITSAME